MGSTTHMPTGVTMVGHTGVARADAAVLERDLQGMLSALSVEFLLGLALATVADYDYSAHTGNFAAHQTILILHIVVAVAVLAGSIGLLVAARKRAPRLAGLAVAGLVATVVSFLTGMARVSSDSEWFTFFMGAGFIVSISVYGQLLGEVLRRQEPEE